MSYITSNDYLNFEIARHTMLSDAQYLNLNLSSRAKICFSIIGHMLKYLEMSL